MVNLETLAAFVGIAAGSSLSLAALYATILLILGWIKTHKKGG